MELAIILTVLVVLLMGILEFGREYSKFQVLQGAAREGGRAASVRENLATVQARIEGAADPYALSNAPTMSTDSGAPQCDPNTVGEYVTVQWDQNFKLTIAFWGNVNFTRAIKAVFRCE